MKDYEEYNFSDLTTLITVKRKSLTEEENKKLNNIKTVKGVDNSSRKTMYIYQLQKEFGRKKVTDFIIRNAFRREVVDTEKLSCVFDEVINNYDWYMWYNIYTDEYKITTNKSMCFKYCDKHMFTDDYLTNKIGYTDKKNVIVVDDGFPSLKGYAWLVLGITQNQAKKISNSTKLDTRMIHRVDDLKLKYVDMVSKDE